MDRHSNNATPRAVELSEIASGEPSYKMRWVATAESRHDPKALFARMRDKIVGCDRVLVLCLFASFIFCIHGITSKPLHPDQMAFIPLFHEGEMPFNPKWFEKPPFHTYFNYFLSVLPISLLSTAFDVSPEISDLAKRTWSKLLTTFLFLGSVGLVFHIARKSFGRTAARVVASIFATSAGFIAHSHFLTADIPVMFWMLLGFYFSHRILLGGGYSVYALAGFFTGIATATKYNGLAVGITIVTGHYLAVSATPNSAWKTYFLNGRLLVGLAMVGLGFVAGNPFSILDYPTFRSDFLYNYMVTPVYEGQTGHSYGKFFWAMVEIIGVPAFITLAVAFGVSLRLALSSRTERIQRATVLLSLAAFTIYYVKFGAFPRLETRFVIPIMPLWFILTAGFWNELKRYKPALGALTVTLLAYNLVCSFYVGRRFLEDPRDTAEFWVRDNIRRSSTIESDLYSPGWKIQGTGLIDQRMPFVTGRERLFEQLFKGNSFILGSGDASTKTDEMVRWYSLEALRKRNPDYLVIDSLYYRRFTDSGIRRELYPSMATFFEALLREQYPYRFVFDKESTPVPDWMYPKEIDFLSNRVTIFARKELKWENPR